MTETTVRISNITTPQTYQVNGRNIERSIGDDFLSLMAKSKYRYTQTWFLGSELLRTVHEHINLDNNKSLNILEIGCFEGLSACFFSEFFLNNPLSTLDCVDPFISSDESKNVTSVFVVESTVTTFLNNIKKSPNHSKVTFHEITSDDFFNLDNKKMYNFIYIDGCHEPGYIAKDMENSFKVLEVGGIMWMDDYGGGDPPGACKVPMDEFLVKYTGRYKLIHKGYQLAIKKTS